MKDEIAGDVQLVNLLEALHSLHRLTATEVTVAGVRALQARDGELRRELRENRRRAKERQGAIALTIRELGGIPTVLSPALGKGIAFLKAQLDGSSTFTSALLGDLALEATLLERARFTGRLAQRLGQSEVVVLCGRLEAAHAETVEWLRARLAELADTGRSRLRPLPTQVAVGGLRKAALVPVAALSRRAQHKPAPPAPAAAPVSGAATIS